METTVSELPSMREEILDALNRDEPVTLSHEGEVKELLCSLVPTETKRLKMAAQIMGLKVCGVDMLEAADGPQIMEIDSSPGLEGIEGATGLDIASEIIDFIRVQADMPEIDLRQRLAVSRGYGVADISIPEGSIFIGKTIEPTGLRDQDVVVLTLKRGDSVISNPKDRVSWKRMTPCFATGKSSR